MGVCLGRTRAMHVPVIEAYTSTVVVIILFPGTPVGLW